MLIKGVVTTRTNESALRQMVEHITGEKKLLLLFVREDNQVAIEAYQGIGFAFSENLVYSDYHETDQEYKEIDNSTYLSMSKRIN